MGLRRLLLLALLPACTTVTEVNAGPVVALPTKEDPSVGGRASLSGALGATGNTSEATVAIEPNMKLSATKDTQDIAFGSGLLYMRPLSSSSVGMVRGGLELLFERFDEKLIMGGGPYAALSFAFVLENVEYTSPGFMFSSRMRERTLLTLGPFAEMEARFSRPSAVILVGLSVGVAWSTEDLGITGIHPPPIHPRPEDTPPPEEPRPIP